MRSKRTSVVIVNYQADEYVKNILANLKNDHAIETIVIDHSDGKNGFGAGCNSGAQQAQGEYLLFVNPDVDLQVETVQALTNFLEDHPSVGIVGPQIRDEYGGVQKTCSSIPNPWQAAIVYSWLEKLPVFTTWKSQYRLFGFDHMTSRPVPAVSGACFAMRRQEFLDIGGCDESLFLYFEEFDLALRMQTHFEKLAYFLASTSVVHLGEKSTSRIKKAATQHFQRSRQTWLKKHYGFSGMLANLWIRLWEKPL